jgi:hypothetical protein
VKWIPADYQLNGDDAVATELEERVVDTHAVPPEQFREGRRQRAFAVGARRPELGRRGEVGHR